MAVQPRLTGIFTFREADLLKQLEIKYGRMPPQALPEVFYEDTLELIRLQRQEGFKLISDGQRLWKDLLRPAYAGMSGVEIGSMTRWYETNGFCFPPRVVGKPLAGNAANFRLDDYFFKENEEIKATQVTLPGPYTLVSLCQGITERPGEELWDMFTTQLKLIAASLPSAIALVEFSEPSLAYDDKTEKFSKQQRDEMLKRAKQAYQQIQPILSLSHKTSLLQLPQANFLKFPEIAEFPVDGFGIDVTETDTCLSRYPSRYSQKISLPGKILSAGAVDAWSSLPEDIEYLAKVVDRAISRWQPAAVYVTSNSQLYQTILHQGALQKLQDIAELARRLS